MNFRNSDLINLQIPKFASANCLSVGDPELFFINGNESTSKAQINAAKKVCENCFHKADCLDFALTNKIPYGIWGGLTESQRRRLLRRAS